MLEGIEFELPEDGAMSEIGRLRFGCKLNGNLAYQALGDH